jgi:hypothetical protein
MKAMKTIVILAVLVIATLALTGVASAATVTKVTPNGAYLGIPTITHPTGVQYPVIGYTYYPTSYVVTYSDKTTKTVTAFPDATGKVTVEGVTLTVAADTASHTLFGPGAIGTSILFENGKPVSTVTGANGAGTVGTFDATFYKEMAAAMGLTDQLIPKTITHNAFEAWMQ